MKVLISSPRRRRSKTAVLGIATLVLVVFIGLSYRQWQRYRQANVEAERSREILTAVDSVMADLGDAETGQRGFLLTGDDAYLQPYNRAVLALPGDLATLKALLSEGYRGMKDFDQLSSLANQKMSELRQTIDVRRTQGAQAALSIVQTDEGMRSMGSIRTICARMQRNEDQSQARASAAEEAAAGTALLITVAGSLVLFSFFAFGLEPFASPNPRAWQRSWFLRYGAAILAVIAITLIRAALTPIMGPGGMPFTLYFCAVAFAGWFGGFRPAVLSILLSLLAGAWFFATPIHSFWVGGHDDQIAMLMIVLVGFAIALLSRSQWSAVERALRAEVSERAERVRFETTLASIGDAVIATDADGRVTFLNWVASALIQCPEAEARGKPLQDVFHIVNELTRAAVESPVGRVLREGQIVGLANHTVLIGRDGTEVPIDDSAAPIRDSGGNIRGTVLVFRDVTERRRTEKQLESQAMLLEQAAAEARLQHHRLGLALTTGKMGVYQVDPAKGDFWWSPEAYSLFGINPAEFKPTRDSFAALIHPEDRAIFMQHWDESIADFQPISREFRIIKLDGKERWISCRGTPVYDETGTPIDYTGVFLDVTERREAEQVRRNFEKLSAAARLSRAVAHGINNPLNAVTNLIYLAKEMPGVPRSIVELLVRAEHEVERVAQVARQALGFYRESSKTEPIDIPELIKSVIEIYSTKFAEKKIKVVQGFMKCAPAYGVRGEIKQVVSNLIANAIEAVNEGGTVSIGTQSLDKDHDQMVEIIVSDDGRGIATEYLDHIFEPFFTTKAGTGTGLGLWVAKEIVERHQGSIEIQQLNGGVNARGATFIVRLPSDQGLGVSNSPMGRRNPAGKSAQDLPENYGTGRVD